MDRRQTKPRAGPPLPAPESQRDPDADALRAVCDAVAESMVVVEHGCRIGRMNWLGELSFGRAIEGALACETPFFRRDACDGCPLAACLIFIVGRRGAFSPSPSAPCCAVACPDQCCWNCGRVKSQPQTAPQTSNSPTLPVYTRLIDCPGIDEP